MQQARYHLQQSLDIASKMGDTFARSAALNNLALVFADAGEIEQAISCATTALELCELHGDRHREAAMHNNLADLFHAAGQKDHSMSHLKKAVVTFTEIGVDSGDFKPEIWKLTEW